MLFSLARPFIFTLDPETAHCVAVNGLDVMGKVMPSPNLHTSPVQVLGLNFPNKVGLAAGFDKNGQHIQGIGKLGFGHIEVGTITPRAQAGNPKPRLFRLEAHHAIINRMGFNNDGVDALVENVKNRNYDGILGINIGKNKDTPNEQALDDYVACLEKVYPLADYIAVNISSPNTAGLRDLQHEDALKNLVEGLLKARAQYVPEHGHKPILVKIAPDMDDATVANTAAVLGQAGIDGIIATNTTISREAVSTHQHGAETGGLSGAPVTQRATEVIGIIRQTLPDMPIIGVGGIMSVADAQAKLDAGANLVQIYTGFIYQGPDLVKDLMQI